MNNTKLNEKLIKASESGDLSLVKDAINNGADTNANYGEALNLASLNGHIEVVKILLQSGIRVRSGDWALFVAKNNNHTEIYELLKGYTET